MDTEKKPKAPRKRKNKNKNVSGESVQKIQLSSTRTDFSIPRMSNNNADAPLGCDGLSPVQHYQALLQSTTGQIPNNMIVTPYNQPYNQQAQYMGFSTPIIQQSDVSNRLDNINPKIDAICDKLNKLDLIENRLTKMEGGMIEVKQKVEDVDSKVEEMERGITYINDQFEENKTEINNIKSTMDKLCDTTTKLQEN